MCRHNVYAINTSVPGRRMLMLTCDKYIMGLYKQKRAVTETAPPPPPAVKYNPGNDADPDP